MTVSFYLGILQLAIGEDVKYSARREAALLAVASMELILSRKVCLSAEAKKKGLANQSNPLKSVSLGCPNSK